MPPEVERHLPFFHVLEALQTAAGCPLCHVERSAVRQFIDSLLYESVNDPGVRGEWRKAKGYCARHAQLLVSFGKGSGAAILYQDQVRLLLEELDRLAQADAKAPPRKQREAWVRREACPACRLQERQREQAIDVLLDGLADAEMRAAFDQCAGLCAPHLFLALGRAANAEQRAALLEVEQRKLQELLADLEEFSRKQDYRFRGEGYGRERDAWRRAAALLAGEAEVF